MKFLTRWFVRIPIMVVSAVLVIAFAIANRKPVLVSLDPFSLETPAIGLQMPLWIALFCTLMAGILLGGAATWTAQAQTSIRRSAKQRAAKREAEAAGAVHQTPIIAPEKKVSVLPAPKADTPDRHAAG